MFENIASSVPNDKTLIHSSWFRNIPSNERESFIKTLLSARHVLKRLREIIKEERNLLENQETSIQDFNSTDWAFKQAFRNGERKGLKLVEDLLHTL